MLFWPLETLAPERYSWELVGGVISSGSSLNGSSQTGIFGGGGMWVLRMERVLIASPEAVLALHKLQGALDQGAEPITFEFPDYGYMVDYLDGAAMHAVANTGAAQNATAIRVQVTSGPPVVAGMEFSVTDIQAFQRRHRVVQSTAVVGQSDKWNVVVRPPFRSAVGAGAILDFEVPSCVMKLADPASIYAPLTAGRYGELNPTFIEYFGTPGTLA